MHGSYVFNRIKTCSQEEELNTHAVKQNKEEEGNENKHRVCYLDLSVSFHSPSVNARHICASLRSHFRLHLRKSRVSVFCHPVRNVYQRGGVLPTLPKLDFIFFIVYLKM
jgi:hypothetical protein